MKVLRRYAFREQKAAAGGELLERVLATVGHDAGARARFRFKDQTLGVSAIARAVRKYPNLERFVLPEIANPAGWVDRLLSNIDTHHENREPCGFVPAETLLALARGVPRSYPFWDMEIFFPTRLPWQAVDDPEPTLPGPENWNLFGEAIQHMSFTIHRSPSGYRAAVRATVTLGDSSEFGAALPPLPPAAAQCLAPFGRAKTHLMLHRMPEEQGSFVDTTTRLKVLHDAWRERSKREMATLALPNTLPVEGTGTQYSPLTVPHKAALVNEFKPRGYRYSTVGSGRGYFELSKLTGNRNRVKISFDVGSLSRNYSGLMFIEGLQGHCCAPLPAHPSQPYQSYQIGSDEAWQQVVENVALLVDHLERVFVPEIDDVLGRTPEWYEW